MTMSDPVCCYFCLTNEDNPLKLGEFVKKGNIRVHYFCLLHSAGLVQNGSDDEGIYGFLATDIRKEKLRTSKIRCVFCYKKYANVQCAESKCRRFFHVPCALQHNYLLQMDSTFLSYCSAHHRLPMKNPMGPKEQCIICLEKFSNYNPINVIEADCCHGGWFHKKCLMEFANSSGYFFKCPLCNNVDDFIKFVQSRGVFIPQRDALWELQPGAFSELLERPQECSATNCFVASQNSKSKKFKFCEICGSVAIHQKCLEQDGKKSFTCTECLKFEQKKLTESVNKDVVVENNEDVVAGSSKDLDKSIGTTIDSESDATERICITPLMDSHNILFQNIHKFLSGNCNDNVQTNCLNAINEKNKRLYSSDNRLITNRGKLGSMCQSDSSSEDDFSQIVRATKRQRSLDVSDCKSEEYYPIMFPKRRIVSVMEDDDSDNEPDKSVLQIVERCTSTPSKLINVRDSLELVTSPKLEDRDVRNTYSHNVFNSIDSIRKMPFGPLNLQRSSGNQESNSVNGKKLGTPNKMDKLKDKKQNTLKKKLSPGQMLISSYFSS